MSVRLVKGLHEPYQALPSASMGNGTVWWRVLLKYRQVAKLANCLSSDFFFLCVSQANMIMAKAITNMKKQRKSLGIALITYHDLRT